MAKKHASDFEKIIHEGRERKQNEALAAKIFNRDRRTSAPASKLSSPGGSLASRVGVKKRTSLGPRAAGAPAPAGNINGEWTHDLHDLGRGRGAPARPGSLAARVSAPGGGARQPRRAAQVAQALIRSELGPAPRAAAQQQVNVLPAPAAGGRAAAAGLSIRGLAGPFVVMAQNFAPGTTAADIESAVTPIGGIVSSCRILKTQPLVIAEIVFESKEGADEVIRTFNNQMADGRLLHVYYRVGGPTPAHRAQTGAPLHAPRGPAAAAGQSGGVVDGTLGFGDPMETDGAAAARPPANGFGGGGGGLYSDQLVVPGGGGGGGGGPRGRGFRGRGRGRGQ